MKISSASISSALQCETGVRAQPFSGSTVAGRDVILINPYCAGGGDHALANKIANIALEEGCRISIVPTDSREMNKIAGEHHRNLSPGECEHDIDQLRDPIFIVAPVGILSTQKLKDRIEYICDKYNFAKNDILLVEEMDLLKSPSQALAPRQKMLRQIGFSGVEVKELGFCDGAIGYLPVDRATADEIESRFAGELTRLLDSYNLSPSKESNYHLAYISSNAPVTSAEAFILNSLVETRDESKDSNFVMVIRDFERYERMMQLKLPEFLGVSNSKFNHSALFSKANLFFLDPNTGKLEKRKEVTGGGQPAVNIVLVKSLPQNIFHDFMRISRSGMASGDQSLGEFLSITGKVPYYDMQPWKVPLVNALLDTADDIGGGEFKKEMQKKISGMQPNGRDICKLSKVSDQSMRSSEFDAAEVELNRYIASRTADRSIREYLIKKSLALPEWSRVNVADDGGQLPGSNAENLVQAMAASSPGVATTTSASEEKKMQYPTLTTNSY
ncbi:hypothetical protein [Burkholderia pyrrocinia]